MKGKSLSMLSLILPFCISILVLCVTAGYYIYRYASERTYRENGRIIMTAV